MPKITSWTKKEDGSLVESDMKFYPCEDGTYEIETTHESIGFLLGPDKNHAKFTVILQLLDEKRIERIKKLVTIGDILVSVNERIVLEESFNTVAALLELLIQGGFARRLKFLNPKKCSVALYLKKLELSGKFQTDMLGFNCSFEYRLDERAFRTSHFNTTNQRDVEWVEYLKSIGGPENLKPAGIFKPSPDLKAIVRRGIPVAFRSVVWQKISLSSIHRLKFPADYYQSLLGRLSELNPKVRDDIEKDVDRTFPEHVYFEPQGQGESGLRRVLQAFALHNVDVGYCQSLNFVVGMMLIFMQEEDAFWLLVTVVEKLLPPDYYTRSMVGTYVDQFVLAHIIKKCLPKIHNAFEANQLQLPLITVQWFMCLFVNTLRPEVTLRVWDMFLNEGSKVIFRIAAALFKLQEAQLLVVKDAADLFSALRNIGKTIVDPDVLIAAAYKNHSPKKMMRVTKTRNNRSHTVDYQSANPRLKTSSPWGVVPRELMGMGLAHVGPRTPVSKSRSTPDMENIGKDNSTLAANNNDNTTSSASDGEDDKKKSSDSADKTVSAVADSLQHLNTNHIGELQNVDQLSDPAYILHRGTETAASSSYPNSDRLSSDYFNVDKLKNRKSAQNQKKFAHKNGDLNFYRADIVLWRSSFRPALEERHLKMEAARRNWSRSSIKNTSSRDSTGLPPESLSTAHPDKILNEAARHSFSEEFKANVKPLSVKIGASADALDDSNSVRNSSSPHTPARQPAVPSPVNISNLSKHSPIPVTSSGKRSPLSNATAVSAKLRSDSVGPISYMDQCIMPDLSYNLDHEFEVAQTDPSAEAAVPDDSADGAQQGETDEENGEEEDIPADLDLEENGSIIPVPYHVKAAAAAGTTSPRLSVTK